tara:strand:+ start:895 stop:1716 length:822 start_codon:yes stop_codon:yes gene_type:complete
MSYFKQFPNIAYDFDRNGIKQNVVDIYRSARPLNAFLDDLNAYSFYEVKNGERPDIVSQRLYGTTQFYWTFFIINDFLHDGLAAWPMSQEKIQAYMNQEFEGVVITTNPFVDDTGDIGVEAGYPNSLSGRFELGETITGTTSGATGILVKKNLDMNQLVLQSVEGSFIGSSAPGPQNATESITGSKTTDSVNTYDVYKYIDAPHNYYRTDDPEKRVQSNSIFINGGEPAGELSFDTNRSHIFAVNDARSKIRVIDPKYITQFVEKYEAIINNV